MLTATCRTQSIIQKSGWLLLEYYAELSPEQFLKEQSLKYGIYLPNFGPFGGAQVLASLAQDAEKCGWDGFSPCFAESHFQTLSASGLLAVNANR